MKGYTIHRKKLKTALSKILEFKDARTVAYRYRTLRGALYEAYPELITNTSREVMLEFLKDAIFLDRILRKMTEGEETKQKKSYLKSSS